MKTKIFSMSIDFLKELFAKNSVHTGYRIIKDGLPKDTIILSASVNHLNMTVDFIVMSAEFDDSEKYLMPLAGTINNKVSGIV